MSYGHRTQMALDPSYLQSLPVQSLCSLSADGKIPRRCRAYQEIKKAPRIAFYSRTLFPLHPKSLLALLI